MSNYFPHTASAAAQVITGEHCDLTWSSVFDDDVWKQALFIPGFALNTLEILKKSFPFRFIFLFLAVF